MRLAGILTAGCATLAIPGSAQEPDQSCPFSSQRSAWVGNCLAVSSDLEHVKWPLLDLVIIPESSGVWLVTAPTPGTTKWGSGSNLISLGVDPVVLLQWATVARKLTAGEVAVTPKLQDGDEFIVLGKNPRGSRADEKFVLVATDSSRGIRWMSYASRAQVDDLTTVLERIASIGRDVFVEGVEPDPDTPVEVIDIPGPFYPGGLAEPDRVGRVWMQFVVGEDGRPREGSFKPLLADDPEFTKATIHALSRARFKPALRNGQPVSQRVFQVVEFR
jgi:Gram-negative bacterial TonB protein C-terminal